MKERYRLATWNLSDKEGGKALQRQAPPVFCAPVGGTSPLRSGRGEAALLWGKLLKLTRRAVLGYLYL